MTWFDRVYYFFRPQALYDEALDFLSLDTGEQLLYASNLTLVGKCKSLRWIVEERMRLNPLFAENLSPLLTELTELAASRGWLSATRSA